MPRKARKPLSEAEIDQLMLLARGNAMARQLRTERAAAPTSRHLACHRGGDATLKILMISDVYFPRVNGVSTSVASFRDALERLGHAVVVLCPDYPVGQLEEPGVLRIASRGVPGDPEDRMMRLGELLALGPELEEAGFDLIHVQTPFVAHVAGIRRGRRRLATGCAFSRAAPTGSARRPCLSNTCARAARSASSGSAWRLRKWRGPRHGSKGH